MLHYIFKQITIIGHLDAVHYQYIHGEMNAESVRQAREKAYVLKDYLDDLFQTSFLSGLYKNIPSLYQNQFPYDCKPQTTSFTATGII